MATQIDELFWTINGRVAPLIQAVAIAQTRIGQFTRFLKRPIGQLTVLGATAALAGAKAVGMAADLDLALREVSTLLPKTVEDMSGLQDQIIELSTRVPEPPEQLTEGLYQVISAGITDTAEAMDVLEVSSKAAVAGLTDTKTAVDAITVTLNAFGLEAEEAERVSDIFFSTVAQGRIRFDEIAGSIGNVATSAGLAGLSVEEMSAALAALTKAGLSAQQSTNALNRLLFSLINSSKEAREAQEALGVEFDLTALKSKGLAKFMEDVRKATGGNIDAMAEINPSIRSLRALTVLAGDSFDEFERILTNTEESTGATQTAFDKIMGSLQRQSEIMGNKINALWQELGEDLLPAAVFWMKQFNNLLPEATTDLDQLATSAANLFREFNEEDENILDTILFGADERAERDKIAELLRQSEAFRENLLGRLQREIEAEVSRGGDEDALNRLTKMRTLVTNLNDQLSGTGDAAGELGDNLQDPTNALGEAEERAGLLEDAMRQLVSTTTTQADDLALQIQSFRDRVTEVFGDEVPAEVERALQNMLDVMRATQIGEVFSDEIDTLVEDLQRLEDQGFITTREFVEFQASLVGARERAVELRDAAQRGTEQWEIYNKLVGRIDKALKRLSKAFKASEDELDSQRDGVKKLGDELGDTTAQLIRMVRGFTDLATATGAFDRDAEQAIRAVTNIGEAVADTLDDMEQLRQKGLEVGGLGDFLQVAIGGGQFTQILGGLGSLAGLIFGGGDEGGPSAAEQARKERTETLRRNTEAIEALRQSIDERRAALEQTPAFPGLRSALGDALGFVERAQDIRSVLANLDDFRGGEGGLDEALREIGVTFEELRAIAGELGIDLERSIDGLIELRRALSDIDLGNRLEGELGNLGLSMDDLQRAADQLGIEFDGSKAAVRQLMEALQAFSTDALQTFQGQIGLLRREFELFDIEDPAERVRRLLDILGTFSNVDIPGDVDPADAESVNDFVQNLFETLRNDPEAFLDNIGKLSFNEFLDLLGEIEGTLDNVEEGVEEGVTQGFQVSRTITEVTGNRIVGTLTTINFWQKQTAEAAGLIAEFITGREFTGLTPPRRGDLPGPNEGSGPSRPTDVEPNLGRVGGGMNVTVNVNGNFGDPENAGRAAARAFVDETDRELARRQNEVERSLGRTQSGSRITRFK